VQQKRSPKDLSHQRRLSTLPPHRDSYKEWDETRKLAWLTEELTTKRPLIPAEMTMTDEVGREEGSTGTWCMRKESYGVEAGWRECG
jgi:phosphoenolpyruvate carboxylase